jgi:hypothetical protein
MAAFLTQITPTLTLNGLKLTIEAAKHAAREFVSTTPEGHWYPCGFAWLQYKCRKNAKEAKVLLDAGFRWDDYSKTYQLSPYEFTNTQSMDYKEAILRKMEEIMRGGGFKVSVFTRID